MQTRTDWIYVVVRQAGEDFGAIDDTKINTKRKTSPFSLLRGASLGATCKFTGLGTVFTKGLKSRVLSLDLSHDLGQDLRLIH